jgi:tetratricopeptide (TPR) repeat protein
MAYVRARGNQLVIAHGERAPGTKNVQQRILATIYSRPEALAILGRGGNADSTHRFRSLLQYRYADLQFDWKKLDKAIAANLDVLPEDYPYESGRLRGRFRDDLCSFLRQLAITDPQELSTSAELIRDHRHELAYLAELIAWRLRTCDHPASEWTADDRFGWRFATRGYGRGAPPEIEEGAVAFYERGEHDRAIAVFQLLIDAFPDYAEGHNYLGLIALAQDDLTSAIEHFETTTKIGRRLFPARMAKKRYWSDLETRPYMRGLRNLALTLNRTGRYDEAERVCVRLADECGDDITVAYYRADLALNRGQWATAIELASRLVEVYPECNFTVALAAFELDRHGRILPAFLHAASNYPRAARMVLGVSRQPEPSSYYDIRDHNCGVSLRQNLHAYLAQRSPRTRRYFRSLLEDPRVSRALDDVLAARVRRDQQHARGEREAFDHLHRVQSSAYAAELAESLVDLVPRTGLTRRPARAARRSRPSGSRSTVRARGPG